MKPNQTTSLQSKPRRARRLATVSAFCALGVALALLSAQSQQQTNDQQAGAQPKAGGKKKRGAGQGKPGNQNGQGTRKRNAKGAANGAGAARTVADTNAMGGGPDTPVPPGGVPVIGDALTSVRLESNNPNGAKLTRVKVDGQPFAEALRIDTAGRTKDENAVRLAWDNATNIKTTDTLFLRFYARLIETQDESAQGRLQITFPNKTPQTAAVLLGKRGVNFGEEWERFDFPLGLRTGAGANAANLVFGLGNTDRQIVEIGGLELLNFGTDVRPSQLPFKRATYAGREADAPWRTAAQERIEKYRKGDLAIKVTDAAGRPVSDAQVKIEMKRHAYGFGTLVKEEQLNDPQFRQHLFELFNTATLSIKWIGWEKRPKTLPPALKLLNDNDFRIHAHTILWPGWRFLPKELQELENQPDKLRETVRAHVREVAELTKGQVDTIDVVNETTGNHALQDILGADEEAKWFEIAHQVDPKVRLYVNENSLENGSKTAHLRGQVQFLQEQKAPIGGFGTQAHVSPSSIPNIISNWEKLNALGLPMQISEYDTVTPDDELQGEFMGDLMTAWFSMPRSDAFIMWGFWDKGHWLSDAPLFYENWTPKPGLQRYKDLVFKAWWTNAQGTTGADGQYKTRGFLGDYDVTVTRGGQTKTVKAKLDKDGETLVVPLG